MVGTGGQMRSYLAVAVGGVLGAALRLAIVTWIDDSLWTIAAINIVGCAVLGLILGFIRRQFAESTWSELARPFLATGVLGGFTTTSAFAVESALLISEGDLLQLVAYVAFSVLGGWFAFTAMSNGRAA